MKEVGSTSSNIPFILLELLTDLGEHRDGVLVYP